MKRAHDIFIAAKKTDRVVETRQIDLSQCIAVKVDHKTIVYVKRGTDIERVKAKFKRTS